MVGLNELHLPRLRQDIQLLEGPAESDGTPTWTLYDPGANKYFKIGWLEFECLVRFEKFRSAQELLISVARETTLEPDEDTIKHMLNFLLAHNLVRANDPGMLAYLEKEHDRRKKPLWERILHGYLYFTIPLFRPQRFLEATLPFVRPLLTRNFFSGVLVLLGYGIFLTLQRWDEFVHTFVSYLDVEGVAFLLLATIFVKIVHELSHAYTATKYGVPVPTMGIAVMVMYPILYTETSNIWRISSRKQRIHIAAAGVMGEMAVASVALILWHVLPGGVAQGVAFTIAVVSMLASLIMNLNPLMRFDGYYLFSDLTGFDNLSDRSFAFARWRLRKILWGWKDPTPEALVPERQHFLEIFGFATWTYRFVLYVGIAVMVYQIFPKPLGFILMMVEVAFFLALPVWREILVWKEGFKRISASSRGKIVFAVVIVLIVSLFIPWQHSVAVPGMMHAGYYKKLYPPAPARLDEILAETGKTVQKDDVLFVLSAPEIDYAIRAAKQKLEMAENIRDREQASQSLINQRPTLNQEIESIKKQIDGLIAQKQQLTIKAGFSGMIRDVNPELREGQWVHPTVLLALLLAPGQPELTGYIREQDISRIHDGAQGYFYPDADPLEKFPVVVEAIEKTDTNSIFWQELSSVYGGPIPADAGANRKPIARYTLYSVKFALDKDNRSKLPTFAARGVIRLQADPYSPIGLLSKAVLSLVWRESGL